MGDVRGETGSDGFFNLYCGECGAECASAGFERAGERAIQLNYVCPNCGEDAVPIPPEYWEYVLVGDGAIPPQTPSATDLWRGRYRTPVEDDPPYRRRVGSNGRGLIRARRVKPVLPRTDHDPG
jgi:hypothetical protein